MVASGELFDSTLSVRHPSAAPQPVDCPIPTPLAQVAAAAAADDVSADGSSVGLNFTDRCGNGPR